jgi:hypothetical protein
MVEADRRMEESRRSDTVRVAAHDGAVRARHGAGVRPHRHDGRRQGSEYWVAVALTLGVIASIAWLPWDHLPKVLQLVPPLLFLLAAGFLRQSGGGAQSGVSAIALLPAFWLARYGGEEFAVLLKNPTPGMAVEVGERVRAAVGRLDLSAWGVPAVSVSVGAAVTEHPDEAIGATLESADRALYRAKRRGRDQVVAA